VKAKPLTKRQQAAVKKDYLAWSGGFTPDLHDKDYVDCGAHDAKLDAKAVDDFIEKWKGECEAKANAAYEKNRVRLKITPEERKGLFKISKKNMKDLEKAERRVTFGDLYDHLHQVGDDTVKAEIEQALVQLLDEETFCRVVGVFAMAVSYD
jgi:hypothetical protein